MCSIFISMLISLGGGWLIGDFDYKAQSIDEWSESVRSKAKGKNPVIERKELVRKFEVKLSKDPFSSIGNPGQVSSFIDEAGEIKSIQRDQSRHRDPLESFSRESLMLIGVIKNDHESYALIRDMFGWTHIARVGTYLGKKNGVITEIADSYIIVNEKEDNSDREVPFKMNLIEEVDQRRR